MAKHSLKKMREKCIFFVFGGFFALFEGDNAGVEGFVGWCFHYLFLFLRAIFIYKNLPVMLQKTRGIVLRTIKYKDTAQIATIYTEVAGRVSFRVPVTRSRHASVRSSQFQPLALVELEADFRRTARVCACLMGHGRLSRLFRCLFILISRRWHCFLPRSYMKYCVRGEKTARCLLI